MKIAVISHCYTIESSPTIKGICRYLVDNGNDVDIYIDDLIRDPNFKINGVKIIKAASDPILRSIRFLSELDGNQNRFYTIIRPLFRNTLKKNINRYDWIICVEIAALPVLIVMGCDLSRVSFLSLESVQTISAYKDKIKNIQEIFKQFAFCIIQSPERGNDLSTYLGIDLDFEYLPVSLLPRQKKITSKELDGVVRIIYSGYFADWAQLLEFLDAYSKTNLREQCQVLLQGHHIGTDGYLAQVNSAAKNLSKVSICTDYVSDKEHAELLDGFNIGLAFYNGPENDPVIGANWQNLIFSSGKIASYLWSGLAVLTNIDCSVSHRPPFLFVRDISSQSLELAFKEFLAHKGEYEEAAFKCAKQYYNLESSMDIIVRRVERVLNTRNEKTNEIEFSV